MLQLPKTCTHERERRERERIERERKSKRESEIERGSEKRKEEHAGEIKLGVSQWGGLYFSSFTSLRNSSAPPCPLRRFTATFEVPFQVASQTCAETTKKAEIFNKKQSN